MLQFDWPKVWDQEVVRSITTALETTIRNALSKTPSDLIRGSVIIDELHFGSVPPVIALSSVRELSPAHSAVVVSFKYAGDASIALRGLQLNLDTTTYVNEKGEDANHAVPFFCPFVMSLVDLVIEGNVLVEVCITTAPATPSTHLSPVAGTAPPAPSSSRVSVGRLLPSHVLNATTIRGHGVLGLEGGSVSRAGSSRAVSPTSSTLGMPSFESRLNTSVTASDTSFVRRPVRQSGVGLLFGAGGRRGMRHPDAPVSEYASPSRYGIGTLEGSFASDAVGWQPAVSAATVTASTSPPQFLLGDLANHRVKITKKTILLQLFGDPIKMFKVESNFAPVQGANEKIAAQLRNVLAPAIERLKTEGLSIHL
ncbi:Hypothetical protein, putative [Bodo saltans]|uniref:SMP-LTD domain-containing protein n=1 Tax=Bodo saltans TaxID=75058 RepID=A0A0S4IYB8_BODSA|nr:Hypothetical protein, putative [Bodo saltans]|eukprot:CUG10193.1 Hypothetical protein, putative [Bodo saltans]